MKIVIYLVYMPTGQEDVGDVKSLIIVDIKLTQIDAQEVVNRHPGSKIQKWTINKAIKS